ncbi:MAG: HEAT repeat domain-containing protein [Flavobacteriales bacterium]
MDMIDKELINEMLIDKYYLIRMLVIKHFDKVSDRKSILTKLLTDTSHKVRQNAVNLIANNHPNSFETDLCALIFDISAYIRFEARRLLNKMNHYDFVQIYRNNLFQQKNSIGSILGLSEVSDESEIPLIQKYLGSERAKVKTAALIGIYNLDSNIGTELAYKVLENENPISTKRTAEKLLTKQSVDYDRLRVLYDATDSDGKKIILRLFNCFSGWSFAGDFLKALTDEDKKIQTMANVFLNSWLHYTVNLGISQNEEDRTYVLTWYKKAKEKEVKVPENIPFIFGEK